MARPLDLEKLEREFKDWKEKDLDPAVRKYGNRAKKFETRS